MLGSSALNTERADRKMHDMLTAFLPTSGKQGKNESPPEFAQFKILCDETSRHGYIHEFIERRGTIRFNYSSVVANWILLSFLVDGPPCLVVTCHETSEGENEGKSETASTAIFNSHKSFAAAIKLQIIRLRLL